MANSANQPTGAPVDDGREVVSRFITALEKRQIENLSALLTEDAVQITAFSPQGGLSPFQHYVGRDAVLAHFAEAFKFLATIKFRRRGQI